ncbi:MAG: O-antigen ligase family protein [Myxococcaceae bacterium]
MVAVVLVVWPWATNPFSSPKWIVTGLAAVAAVALLPRDARRPGSVAIAALANLGACLASMLLDGGPTPWWTLAGPLLVACLALSAAPMPWSAIAWAGGLSAMAVLLQALGADPFASFAPELEGARLRLYGTLGNPDFVASVLGVTAPLSAVVALRRGAMTARLLTASTALQLLALALLRSFATLLSLGAAVLIVLLAGPRERSRRALVLALCAGLLVAALPLAGRSAGTVLQGRLYLWTTAAPHVAEAPLLGRGPGAVVLHWPRWELARWKARCGEDAGCVRAQPESRFAGLQDHLHDDWLERLLEGGVGGLAALLALFVTALAAALRSGTLEGLGVAAGLASLAARATVDFPLSRPADLVLLAVLAGAAAQQSLTESVDRDRGSPGDSPPDGGIP